MMLSILIAAMFEVSAPTTAELAKEVGQATSRPAVIVDHGYDKLRAARFEWDDVPGFADQLRQIFGFRPATADERKAGSLGFNDRWPVSVVASAEARALLAPQISGGPPGAVGADGPVDMPKGTPATPQGSLSGGEDGLSTGDNVAIGPASKFAQGPLHWFLGTVPVAIYAQKASAESVRAAILAAVGALPDGAPRWNELRSRFVGGCNTAARYAREEPGNAGAARAQSYQLKSWFFGTLPDVDLKKAFASPGARLEYVGEPRSPLYNYVWNMLRAVAERPQPARTGSAGGNQSGGGLSTSLPPIDPRQPVKLVYTSPVGFQLVLRGAQSDASLKLP